MTDIDRKMTISWLMMGKKHWFDFSWSNRVLFFTICNILLPLFITSEEIHIQQSQFYSFFIYFINSLQTSLKMEFPTLGDHCQQEGCNQTDFLPLQCKCGKVLCRVHFLAHCQSSECELAPKPREVNLKSDDQIFKCSEKGCRKGNLHEMLCVKCQKHYCIEHRFHP